MKNWKKLVRIRAMPALMLLALAAFGQLTAQAQNSAGGSKNSGTAAAKRSEPRVESRGKERVSSPRVAKRQAIAQDLSEPGTIVTGSTSALPDAGQEEARAGRPRDSRRVAGATPDDIQRLINSCAAAVEDLARTRVLVEALEKENSLLKERLETEKRTSAVLLELNETRKAEAVSLRETVAAKNETIAAKDGVIASQDKLIEALKKKKTSPLKRIGDVLIGVALAAILR